MYFTPSNNMAGEHGASELHTGSENLPTDYPRPHFFIVRPDKTLVPLVALDELDPRFCVIGTPITLTAGNIEEWNMARVGDLVDPPKQYYHIECIKNACHLKEVSHDQVQAHDDNEFSQDMQALDQQDPPLVESADYMISSLESENGGSQPDSGVSMGLCDHREDSPSHSAEHLDSLNQTIKENKWAKQQHPSKTKNAMTPGIYGKKKFCTYWIRTGNCDYVQEGCKYLHVIPDEETRLRIGIRDMPRWAKEDLPAPEQPVQSKKPPAMSQDWRRTRSGPAPGISATAYAQSRAPVPAPTRFVKPNGVQKGSKPSTSPSYPNPTAKPFEASSNTPAQCGPQTHTSHAGIAATPAPESSTATTAADSFHRQMHANQASHYVQTNTTPVSHQYSQQGQAPISQPSTSGYRAPDKMTLAHNTSTYAPFANHASASDKFSMMNQQANSGPSQPEQSNSIQAPSPWNQTSPYLGHSLKSLSLGSRSSTPATYMGDGRGHTPASPVGVSFGSRMANGGYNFLTRQQSPFGGQKSSAGLGAPSRVSSGAATGFDEMHTSRGNEPVKQSVNASFKGQSNQAVQRYIGLSGVNLNTAATMSNESAQPSNPTNGSASPSVILHPRRFAAPGEPKFAAASVEDLKLEAKRTDNMGHKRSHGKARNGHGGQLVEI